LYVAARTSTSFTVKEQKGGTSGTVFSYRIVARRKDVAAPRFAKVNITPAVTLPTPDPKLLAKPAAPPAPVTIDTPKAPSLPTLPAPPAPPASVVPETAPAATAAPTKG